MAQKATYLPARLPDSQTLRGSTRALMLADGESIDNLTITMYRGGVITGRVLDAHGDPVEFAQVQALRLPKSGRGKPQQAAAASANDIGEYRLARLSDGKYLLMVQPQRRDIMPVSVAQQASVVPEPHSLPTFYPGVLALDEAQALDVKRGSLLAGFDLTLGEGIAAVVSGVVVDDSGQPVTRNASLMLRAIVKDVTSFPMPVPSLTNDGTFRLRLTPGEYEIAAQAWPAAPPGAPPVATLEQQHGSVRLAVEGDLTGVVIQLGLGANVAGRVVFDGDSLVPEPPPATSPLGAVLFSSRDGSTCRPGKGQVAGNWTFTVEGVFGTCVAQFVGNAPGWTVKSITHQGKELIDRQIEFTTGQRVRNLQIVLTDKQTEVAFHVADDRGSPTREYVGILFPADSTRWFDGTGRNVRTVVPTVIPPAGTRTNGVGAPTGSRAPSSGANTIDWRHVIGGITPGDYLAVAVDDIEPDAIRDPELLGRLAPAATRVTVKEGSPARVNLRRIVLAAAN
jgi:hypothetical protein